MPRSRSLLLVFGLLIAVLLPAASASALSFPVTSTGDGEVKGTLRGSIEEANTNPGSDAIPIQVTGTIELGKALPTIEEGVEISGPGAAGLTVRRVSSSLFPVFEFSGDGKSTLEGITVTGGSSALGGGISNGGGALTVARVAVVDNQATAGHILSTIAHGGGINSLGPLTLVESTVAGNRAAAVEGSGETDAEGGGIFAFGKLTIDRSTVSGNVAESTPGGGTTFAMGGGIFAQGGGLVSGSTITGNSVTGGGSGSPGFIRGSNLSISPGLSVRDTIVSAPKGEAESCAGAVPDSGGYNLDEDGSCEFGAGSDLNGVAAGLDPVLRDNGGPTPTHALLEGSLAIDRGNSFGATTDQRGLPRPSDFPAISNKEGGDGSDIGAFEVQAPPQIAYPGPLPILVGAEPGDRTPPRTRIVSGPARVGFKRRATFRFASSEGQSSFRCKLDRKRWRGCRSPRTVRVKPGKHLFKVRAIDRFGNADPTPARFGWRVKPVG
jgi:hypothetical protein